MISLGTALCGALLCMVASERARVRRLAGFALQAGIALAGLHRGREAAAIGSAAGWRGATAARGRTVERGVPAELRVGLFVARSRVDGLNALLGLPQCRLGLGVGVRIPSLHFSRRRFVRSTLLRSNLKVGLLAGGPADARDVAFALVCGFDGGHACARLIVLRLDRLARVCAQCSCRNCPKRF